MMEDNMRKRIYIYIFIYIWLGHYAVWENWHNTVKQLYSNKNKIKLKKKAPQDI